MRRTEIIDGVKQVVDALMDSKLLPSLGSIINSPRSDKLVRDQTPEILGGLRRYALFAHQYNGAAKTVAEIMELSDLENEILWAELLSPENFRTMYETYSRIRFAIERLPSLARLIEQDSLKKVNTSAESRDHGEGMRILSVIVFEEKNTYSSPIRLAMALESINHFYTACALMEGESPSTLSVVACDSGSDKSFDFLGLAKVMECVERIIGTIWDRLVFYKERQFDERLNLVSKSLPIIEHISGMEEQKQIDPELAAILKRNVFDGANKFIQSGAAISELEGRALNPPRALLSPVQKLLASAPIEERIGDENEEAQRRGPSTTNGEVNESTAAESELVNLTADEREMLRKLLGKATRNEKTPSSQSNVDSISDNVTSNSKDSEVESENLNS